ncbi:MAG TPA: 50S ribosomal protein L32 [Candidatus Humimicrobiaceae bacterium]
MAAVPKGKRSKSKRDMKRNGFKLGVLSVVECPRCRAKKVAHRVCTACGYYDNKEIIKIKVKSKVPATPEEKAKAKAEAKAKAKVKAKSTPGRGRRFAGPVKKEAETVKPEKKETEPAAI